MSFHKQISTNFFTASQMVSHEVEVPPFGEVPCELQHLNKSAQSMTKEKDENPPADELNHKLKSTRNFVA